MKKFIRKLKKYILYIIVRRFEVKKYKPRELIHPTYFSSKDNDDYRLRYRNTLLSNTYNLMDSYIDNLFRLLIYIKDPKSINGYLFKFTILNPQLIKSSNYKEILDKLYYYTKNPISKNIIKNFPFYFKNFNIVFPY